MSVRGDLRAIAPPATTAASSSTLARLAAVLAVVVPAFAGRERGRFGGLVAGRALEELDQEHGVVDHLAAAGELGLTAALLRRLQLALCEQEVANPLAVAPRDVELDDHRMAELVDGCVELAAAQILGH